MIIGGGEDRGGKADILREFVRLAGGPRARILVIPVASSEIPRELCTEYTRCFHSVGCAHIESLLVDSREEANEDEAVRKVEHATGIFFTGGDQFRIASILGGTKVDAALRRRFEEGAVLSGTSAGATMMSSHMILGASSERRITSELEVGAGLEFLPGVVIDQHFSQRGRLHRLLSAVAKFPHYIGLGIDENTALVVTDKEFRVIGEGAVTVIDAGQATFNNVPEISDGKTVAAAAAAPVLIGIQVHILSAGCGFDLAARHPLPPSEAAAAANGISSNVKRARRRAVPRKKTGHQ